MYPNDVSAKQVVAQRPPMMSQRLSDMRAKQEQLDETIAHLESALFRISGTSIEEKQPQTIPSAPGVINELADCVGRLTNQVDRLERIKNLLNEAV